MVKGFNCLLLKLTLKKIQSPEMYYTINKSKGQPINSESEKQTTRSLPVAQEMATNLHKNQQSDSSAKRTPQYNLGKNVEIELEDIPEDLFLEAKWKIWEVIFDTQKTAFARKQVSQNEILRRVSVPTIETSSLQSVKPQLSSSSASNPKANIIKPKVYISNISTATSTSAFSPMTSQNPASFNFRPISGPVKSFVIPYDKPYILKISKSNPSLKRHNLSIPGESAINTNVYTKRHHSSIPSESAVKTNLYTNRHHCVNTIVYTKRHHSSIPGDSGVNTNFYTKRLHSSI